MMKDTFFSLPRFMMLCRKEVIENWKSNVLRVVGIYGGLLVFMLWPTYRAYTNTSVSPVDPAWYSLLGFFFVSMWIFGCFSASMTMGNMKLKTSRTAVLMLPATPFEKFFSRWFIYTIVFLLVFLIAYRLADYTRVVIFSLAYPEKDFIAPINISYLVKNSSFLTDNTNLEFSALMSVYFLTQSLFVLGSSIWPKNTFLKTFGVGILILTIYVSVGAMMNHLLLDNGRYYSNFLNFSEKEALCTLMGVCLFFAFLNWTLAYFRFKESEIINRM